MVCDNCGFYQATYHSKVNINGSVTESHLCEECAVSKNKVKSIFSNNNVGAFFGNDAYDDTDSYVVNIKNKVCDFCGKSYDDFVETGLLGCAKCYKVFEERLMPIIKSMQPGIFHNGKTPYQGNAEDDNEIKRLEYKLKQAVASENYELASELKKKINELRYMQGDE